MSETRQGEPEASPMLIYSPAMPRKAREPLNAPATELSPRRLPTQQRARETVEQVLLAAGTEIEREGLDKLTTKRIAAAAGLSVGAIYEYFPNKEAIVHALADQWLGKVREAVDAVHPRHGGGRGQAQARRGDSARSHDSRSHFASLLGDSQRGSDRTRLLCESLAENSDMRAARISARRRRRITYLGTFSPERASRPVAG